MAVQKYTVPYQRDDGVTFEIPITAESPDDAAQILSLALETGELDPSTFPTPNDQNPQIQPAEKDSPNALGGFEADAFRTDSLVAGTKKLGLDVIDFGLQAASALVPESLFPDTQGGINKQLAEFKDFRRGQEAEQEAHFQSVFGTAQPSPAGLLLGETIPMLPLSFIPALQGSTFTRMLASNSAQGGLISGLSASGGTEGLDELFGSMTVGAAFGAGVTSLFGSMRGIQSFAGRKYGQQLDAELSKQNLALEKQIQDLTGNKDFSFTVGQIGADNPYLVGLERGATGRTSLKLQNERMQTVVNFLETKANDLTPVEIAEQLHQTVSKVTTDMRKLAARNYDAQIEGLMTQNGDNIILDGREYLASLREIVGEMGDPRRFNRVSPSLLKHMGFIETRVMPFKAERIGGKWAVVDRSNPGAKPTEFASPKEALEFASRQNAQIGGLTTEDTVEILRGHRELISGESSLFEAATSGSDANIGKFLQMRMLNAMRGGDKAAIEGIKRARNGFQVDMQKLRVLKESALGKLFGDKVDNLATNPEAALVDLLGRSPTALRNTRDLLSNVAPDVLNNLQGVVIRRALQQSRNPAAGSALIETDLNKLANQLSGAGKKESAGRIGFGLFSPGEQQELIRVGKALRTLNTTYIRDVAADTAGIAADTTINVVSQSKEFMARYLTRIFTKGGTIERLMVDPKARSALVALGENGPDSPAFKMATLFLATWYGQDQMLAQAERREEQLDESSAARERGD